MILSKGTSSQALTTAEQTLQGTKLDDDALIPLSAALTALIYTDQLETAALWCGRLLGQATERRVSGWQATFGGLAAGVAFRRGRLAEVEALARIALGYPGAMGNDNPGGAPVAALLRALTAMGRLTEAGQLLERRQPENLHQSLTGLAQLQARGHYYLAINRVDAALDDFLTCGSLVSHWNLDLPAIRVVATGCGAGPPPPRRERGGPGSGQRSTRTPGSDLEQRPRSGAAPAGDRQRPAEPGGHPAGPRWSYCLPRAIGWNWRTRWPISAMPIGCSVIRSGPGSPSGEPGR